MIRDLLIFSAIGYAIGSLSPGYFFGRIVKNVDIRNFRNRNTGASNTYHVVGRGYGVIAGIFDGLKAAAAYFIAVSGIPFAGIGPINPDFAIIAGLAAVAGHIWPFYLHFRGGRGAASLAALGAIAIFYTTSWAAFFFIVGGSIYGIILNRVKFEAPVRKVLKLCGIIFPLGMFWAPHFFIAAAGTLLFVSAAFDLLRFSVPRLNIGYLKITFLAKQKEKRFLSGYTLFLFSVYFVLRFFPLNIAVFSLTAFIFADLLAPIGKKIFLPLPLIKEKTLGGALIAFAVAFLTGVFLRSLASFHISTAAIQLGALTVAVLDQFSFILDDNLLVPIGTAIMLYLFQL